MGAIGAPAAIINAAADAHRPPAHRHAGIARGRCGGRLEAFGHQGRRAHEPDGREGETRGRRWTARDSRRSPPATPAGLELWAYLDAYTFRPGEEVAVKVHTTASSFDLEVVCDSGAGGRVHAASRVPGRRQETPSDAYAEGCGWEESHTFRIAPEWPAGVYLVSVRAERDGDAVESETFFVLAPRVPGASPRGRSWCSPPAPGSPTTTGGAPMPTGAPSTGWRARSPRRACRCGGRWPAASCACRHGAPRYTDSPDLPPFGHPRYPWLEWAFAYGYSRHCRDAGWATYERPFAYWAARIGLPARVPHPARSALRPRLPAALSQRGAGGA